MHLILLGITNKEINDVDELKRYVDDIETEGTGIDYIELEQEVTLKECLDDNDIRNTLKEDSIYSGKEIPKGSEEKIASAFCGYYDDGDIDYEFNYKIPYKLPLNIKEAVYKAKQEEIKNHIKSMLLRIKPNDMIFLLNVHI